LGSEDAEVAGFAEGAVEAAGRPDEEADGGGLGALGVAPAAEPADEACAGGRGPGGLDADADALDGVSCDPARNFATVTTPAATAAAMITKASP